MVRLEQKKTMRKATSYVIWLIGCLVVTVFFVGPFIWMVSSSFKPPKEIYTFPPTLLPQKLQIDNYRYAWQAANWLQMFLNSSFITGTTVVLQLSVNSLAGFAFAKIRFPGKEVIFFVVIGALLIPLQIPLIPRFLMMLKMGLVGTSAPLIILAAGQALHTFLFRQFFMSIPDELIDAAKMDGASFFLCFRSIAVPLSKPVFAALGIFSFVWTWNAFIYPLIYLGSNSKLFTVQVGLSMFTSAAGIKFGPLMAASTFVALPTILVYIIFQRHFVQGIVMTGMKN